MLDFEYLHREKFGLDFIGDVHGCAKTLIRLLDKLGYSLFDDVYQHPSRKVVFIGDIIDRGPRIRESLNIVKAMVDAGQAECILGNHEFNAVAYTTVIQGHTKDPHFLRVHDYRNNRLILETLCQFACFPEEWRAFLKWFEERPLYIESSQFRAVHACWDERYIRTLESEHNNKPVTLGDILPRLKAGDKAASKYLDRLTRGTSLKYPDDRYVLSKDGVKRRIFRAKFWADQPITYGDVAFQPDPLPEDLFERPLSDDERAKLISYPNTRRPVFFGHYWLQGKPRIQQENLACLDYSAVKYGRLVAYRFDGEQTLNNNKFEWVYVDPAQAESSV